LSKLEKTLTRVRSNPRNTSLEDFEGLINAYGYIERGAKHPKAIISNRTLPYKAENPVKSCYVKELLDIIDEINYKKDETNEAKKTRGKKE
jgi:dihydroorotate dehydrogenase